MENLQKYISKAIEMGAADAVAFKIEDICFDSRTLLKCMFGCSDWGRNHTCPSRPNNASIEEYRKMLSLYSSGIIIHTHDKHLSQKVSFEIEAEAFRDGYYFAFSLSDCGLCTSCAAASGTACRNIKEARPSFHSVGIDVFKTVRAFGLPIQTLSDPLKEQQNWYSAVFIE